MNLLKSLLVLPHTLWFSLVGIVGIGFLIGFHELGHFLFAKLFHVRTPSFSIGFGPQLISKKLGDTTFSLSAIPLGGYVEVAGMAEVGQGEQEEAQSTAGDSFAVKPFWQKLLILFGGILFNLFFAYASLSLLFMVGAPKSDIVRVLKIAKEKPIIEKIIGTDSPALAAGLKEGDLIIGLNQEPINGNVELLKERLRALPGQEVSLEIDREGTRKTIPATLGSMTDQAGKQAGYLGLTFEIDSIPSLGFFASLKQGFRATNIYIMTVAHAFKNMFQKRDLSNVGGPLKVISETIKGAQQGWKIFLLFLAVISINLAVLNLLPLPILDGGQILFVTIEAIIRRPLPLKIREYIHMASWFLILGLMLYLTIKDAGIFKWLGFGK